MIEINSLFFNFFIQFFRVNRYYEYLEDNHKNHEGSNEVILKALSKLE